MKTMMVSYLGPIYTSHFSRIECNSSPKKLAEVASNQRNDHTNNKGEHVRPRCQLTRQEAKTLAQKRVRWIAMVTICFQGGNED